MGDRWLAKDETMPETFQRLGGLQGCVLVGRDGPSLCLISQMEPRRLCGKARGVESIPVLCGPSSCLQLSPSISGALCGWRRQRPLQCVAARGGRGVWLRMKEVG